jgi:hypothetical protein
MKSKFKVLAAAVAFAAAGSANATILAGSTPTGEHVFSVWDTVAKVGYVRDLGLTQDVFNPTNAVTQTFAADTTLSGFLSGRNLDNLLWNVAASETQGGVRLFTTVNTDPPSQANSTVRQAASGMANWVAQVNQQPTHNSVADGSAVIPEAAGIAWPGSSSWGTNMGGQFLPNAGVVGAQLEFWGFSATSITSPSSITPVQFKNDFGDSYWTFLSDGTLNFVVAQDLEPIPEPSTWALMIAGLLGLGAVARRRAAK